MHILRFYFCMAEHTTCLNQLASDLDKEWGVQVRLHSQHSTFIPTCILGSDQVSYGLAHNQVLLVATIKYFISVSFRNNFEYYHSAATNHSSHITVLWLREEKVDAENQWLLRNSLQ